MTIHTIPRTGKAPLTFKGERIAHATSTPPPADRRSPGERKRYHELTLYRTDNEQLPYVVHVRYCTSWPSESTYDTVIATGNPFRALAYAIDPLDGFVGYPNARGAFAERQARLEKSVRLAYDHAVSQLLEAFPEQLSTKGGNDNAAS